MLAADGRGEDALVGAGTDAFQMGQYSHPIEYFDRLQRRMRMAPNAAEMLVVCPTNNLTSKVGYALLRYALSRPRFGVERH